MQFSMVRDFPEFTVFDFETTGLGPNAQITEIGAVRVDHGEFLNPFSTLINPGIPIPFPVQQLTGITDRMVSKAPAIEEVMPAFLDYLGDTPIIAHNAAFDCTYLYRDAARLGRTVPNTVVDTMRLARKVWPKLPSYKLVFLTDYHGIAQENAHRAWCDAKATAKLYLMMHP